MLPAQATLQPQALTVNQSSLRKRIPNDLSYDSSIKKQSTGRNDEYMLAKPCSQGWAGSPRRGRSLKGGPENRKKESRKVNMLILWWWVWSSNIFFLKPTWYFKKKKKKGYISSNTYLRYSFPVELKKHYNIIINRMCI